MRRLCSCLALTEQYLHICLLYLNKMILEYLYNDHNKTKNM